MSQSSNKQFHGKPKSGRQWQQQERVVEFFLNLYSIQLNAPKNSPRVFKLKSHSQSIEFTYELKVRHAGKWVSRLMGILPIGEEAGKKSNCFKVIYDDILVIKIPRSPINDFEKYIDVIRKERKIATTLHPDIECIVPAVSSILKKIPSFFESMCWIPEEVEDKCIERLKQFPLFQDYLKLSGELIFFMDISKYSFLTQVLENIFDADRKVKQEIIKHPDFLSKFQKFEERYGIENTSIWLKMSQIFHEYQIEINSLLKTHGLDTKIHDYKRRNWFLIYLAEKKIISDEYRFSDIFFYELNHVLAKLASQYGNAFRDYTAMVRAYVKKETFRRAKSEISGILSGILRLLSLLREKKIAVRDLKPDNIFVAGNVTRESTQYSQRDDVHLGLIDLETAVSASIIKLEKLEQPLPGGTPSYGTPSNFVSNEIIEKLFKDVSRILYLQDWHACICMIYLVVTGEVLFNRSKNLLYDFINSIQNSQTNQTQSLKTFEAHNNFFWQSAQNEFIVKTAAKKKLLNEIEVAFSVQTYEMFNVEALKLKNEFDLRIKNILNAQQLFKNSKDIENLLNSSPEMVCRLRKKWQKINQSSRRLSKSYEEAVLFLQKLEELKMFAAKLTPWIKNLKNQTLTVSVASLLDFMFHVVLEGMYSKQLTKKNDI
ncbi:MAG: hypothetical protein R6U27_08155 [Desulfobacterales bacterium]